MRYVSPVSLNAYIKAKHLFACFPPSLPPSLPPVCLPGQCVKEGGLAAARGAHQRRGRALTNDALEGGREGGRERGREGGRCEMSNWKE